MKKFLIEVPHGDDKRDCINAMKIFLQTGSHFLAKAEWGCFDGIHKAWLIVEVESKDEARQIVPPAFRSQAKIMGLSQVTQKDLDNILEQHADFRAK